MSGRVGEGKTVSPYDAFLRPCAPRPFTPSRMPLAACPTSRCCPLILGHDGIWYVPATPESDTSFTRPSRHSPFQPSRLAPFVAQRYAPTGCLQASPLTPGLMLDIYV